MVSKRDPVELGVVILSSSGTAVSSNPEADRILALRDGLEIGEIGRPLARRTTDNALLADAITYAVSGSSVDPSRQTTLRIARPSDSPPFLIRVVPLNQAEAALNGTGDGAVLYLLDPARHPALVARGPATFFGFTPEEAVIAELIANGLELDDLPLRAAEPQMAALLEKTNAGRPARLVALLRLLILLDAASRKPGSSDPER